MFETARIFGVEPGTLPPTFQELLDLVHPDDRQRVRESVMAPDDAGKIELEYRIIRADGVPSERFMSKPTSTPNRVAAHVLRPHHPRRLRFKEHAMFTKSYEATVLVVVFLMLSTMAWGDQPKLGFNGTLVDLPGEYQPFRGFRVDQVRPGTPAAEVGLERGDVVVFIGRTMAFTTHEAYLYALRQQGAMTEITYDNLYPIMFGYQVSTENGRALRPTEHRPALRDGRVSFRPVRGQCAMRTVPVAALCTENQRRRRALDQPGAGQPGYDGQRIGKRPFVAVLFADGNAEESLKIRGTDDVNQQAVKRLVEALDDLAGDYDT